MGLQGLRTEPRSAPALLLHAWGGWWTSLAALKAVPLCLGVGGGFAMPGGSHESICAHEGVTASRAHHQMAVVLSSGRFWGGGALDNLPSSSNPVLPPHTHSSTERSVMSREFCKRNLKSPKPLEERRRPFEG